jgi:hypothetical protein
LLLDSLQLCCQFVDEEFLLFELEGVVLSLEAHLSVQFFSLFLELPPYHLAPFQLVFVELYLLILVVPVGCVQSCDLLLLLFDGADGAGFEDLQAVHQILFLYFELLHGFQLSVDSWWRPTLFCGMQP